jgi:hypothetical protein
MSVMATAAEDVGHRVRASVLETLTEHLAMDRQQVSACLEGATDDLPIASRVAIVVIARAQKVFGVADLVDPKMLRPEEITGVRSVAELLITKLQDRLG